MDLWPSPEFPQQPLGAQLSGDVQRCSRRQQLPATVGPQLQTLKAFWVDLRQEVGGDVTRDEAGVGDDLPQEGDVVGDTWRENYQTSLQEEKYAHLKRCLCILADLCEGVFVYL